MLRPRGLFIFTVPMSGRPSTATRAKPGPDGPVHLLEPEYHGDRIRGRVLSFRTYGDDIVDRLREAGFEDARLEKPAADWLGFFRPVVVARKAAA